MYKQIRCHPSKQNSYHRLHKTTTYFSAKSTMIIQAKLVSVSELLSISCFSQRNPLQLTKRKKRKQGGESVAAPTGKSISVSVRACVRAVVGRVKSRQNSGCRGFPFSLFLAGGFSLFPFRGGRLFPFPFSGREAFPFPFPPPPNLLSSISWPYRVHLHLEKRSCLPVPLRPGASAQDLNW